MRSTTNPVQPRYVYFIRAVGTDFVKIGVSVNPEARRGELQVGNHCRLEIEGTLVCHSAFAAYKMETALHDQYMDRKVANAGGEWFVLPTDAVLRKIESHAHLNACLLNAEEDPLPSIRVTNPSSKDRQLDRVNEAIPAPPRPTDDGPSFDDRELRMRYLYKHQGFTVTMLSYIFRDYEWRDIKAIVGEPSAQEMVARYRREQPELVAHALDVPWNARGEVLVGAA
jgi:hypothetical protein